MVLYRLFFYLYFWREKKKRFKENMLKKCKLIIIKLYRCFIIDINNVDCCFFSRNRKLW